MAEIDSYQYDYEFYNDSSTNFTGFEVLESGKYQMVVENPLDMQNLWRYYIMKTILVLVLDY